MGRILAATLLIGIILLVMSYVYFKYFKPAQEKAKLEDFSEKLRQKIVEKQLQKLQEELDGKE